MAEPRLNIFIVAKALLTDLDKGVRAVGEFKQRVQKFNAEIANGSRAASQVIGNLGTALAALGLKNAFQAAIESRRNVAQLDAALRSTGQGTADYRAELLALAAALKQQTGQDDDAIIGTERLLISFGAARVDIAELTRLTLDLAAAQGTDLQSAALTIGRALQGEDISLRGLRLTIDRTLPKQEQLRIAKQKLNQAFGGQAAAAFRSEGAEVQRFTLALDDLRKTVGRLELRLIEPFLQGFNRGLRELDDWLKRVQERFPALAAGAESFARGFGDLAASPVGGILLGLAAGALALRGILLLFGPLLNLTRVAFFAAFGVSIVDAIQRLIIGLRLLTVTTTAAQYGAGTLAFGWGAVALVVAGTSLAVGKLIHDLLALNRETQAAKQNALDAGAAQAKLLEKRRPFLEVKPLGAATIDLNIDRGAIRRDNVEELIRTLTEGRKAALAFATAFDPEKSGLVPKARALREQADALARDIAQLRAVFAAPVTSPPVVRDEVVALEDQTARLRAVLELQQLAVQRSYDTRAISLTEFVRRQQAIITAQFGNELEALDAALTQQRTAREAAAADSQERRDAEAKIGELTTKRVETVIKQQAALDTLQDKAAAERLTLDKRRTDIEIALAEQRGQAVLAADKKFAEEHRELTERLQAEGDQAALAQLNDLRALTLSSAGLEQIQKFTGDIEAALQRNLAAVDVQVNVGALSKREGLAETLRLKRDAAAASQSAIAQIEQGAAERGQTGLFTEELNQITELQARTQALRPTLEELASTSDSFTTGSALGFKRISDATLSWSQVIGQAVSDFAVGFANATAAAFTGFINGTKSAAQAFREFAASVLTQIAQLIISQLILNSLQSAFPGFFKAGGGPVSGSAVSAKAAGGPVGQPSRLAFLPFAFSPFRFPGGGAITGPGGPTDDRVPIWASPGEWVIRASSVAKYGPRLLAAVNAGLLDAAALAAVLPGAAAPAPVNLHYAGGGSVPAPAFAGSSAGGLNRRSDPAPGRSAPAPVNVLIGDAEIARLAANSQFAAGVRASLLADPRFLEQVQRQSRRAA